MAALNFPNSPSVNDIHTENGVSFKWNGTIWKKVGASYLDTTNLNVTGIGTFAGAVNIGGVLTYEDVKNVDSIGIITARNGINMSGGTATFSGETFFNDKITHKSDTNTSIRFPANDTFSVETAGQQNVQVNGTRVLLKSPSGTDTTVRLQHQGNSGYGDIILDRSVNAFIISNDPSNASSNQSYFSVKNKGVENLRITSAGKLGLGVASPASESGWGNILHINSASAGAHIRFTDNTSGSGAGDGSYIGHYGNDTYLVNKESSGVIIFNTNSAERFRINNIGIGTFKGNLTFGANSKAQLFENGNQQGVQSTHSSSSAHLMTHDGNEDIHVDPSGYIKFEVGGSERLRITSTERFGFGLNTPQTTIHVSQVDAGFWLGNPLGDSHNSGQVPTLKLYSDCSEKKAYIDVIWGGDNNFDRNITFGGSYLALHSPGSSNGAETLRVSNDNIEIPDNSKIRLGASGDFEIYHDGSNSILNDNGTGSIRIAHGGANHWEFGDASFKGNDGRVIILGDSSDFRLYHATDNIIDCKNDKNLKIVNDRDGGNENMAVFDPNGAVDIYYNGTRRIATTNSGIRVWTTWDSNAGIYVDVGSTQNGTAKVATFVTSHYGGERGSIGLTLSGTSYNTSSDYRMKENVVSLTGATSRIKNLKPKRFNFKEDDKTIDGFLAHEVSSVVPEAVTGEKDGTEMQQLDYSKLATLTVAALQEAIAKIEALEAKVTALESA